MNCRYCPSTAMAYLPSEPLPEGGRVWPARQCPDCCWTVEAEEVDMDAWHESDLEAEMVRLKEVRDGN